MKIMIDTSTSMLELGKKDSLIYIVKSIQDYLDIYKKQYSVIDFEGNLVDLQQLDFKTNINFDAKVLDCNTILISDGLFDVEDEIKKGFSIQVGIDANEANLLKLTNKVFTCENILEAIETFYYFQNNIEESADDEW